MLYQYCSELLTSGHTSIQDSSFVESEQVISCLQTGIKARKLRSLKSLLFMIELLRTLMEKTSDIKVRTKLFDNFIEYLYSSYDRPMAMAAIKYAVANRRISVPRQSSGFQIVKDMFGPVLLGKDKQVHDSEYQAFMKSVHIYDKMLARSRCSDEIRESMQMI